MEIDLDTKVKNFNSRVTSAMAQKDIDSVPSTQILFNDRFEEENPVFGKGSANGFLIKTKFISFINKLSEFKKQTQSGKKNEESKSENLPSAHQGIDNSLNQLEELAIAYINYYEARVACYTDCSSSKIKEKLSNLKQVDRSALTRLIEPGRSIRNINQYVRKNEAQINYEHKRLESQKALHTSMEKALALRNSKNFSVREICNLCNIRKATYLKFCRRADSQSIEFTNRPPKKIVRSFIKGLEFEEIKKIVKDPLKNFTVNDICMELKEHQGLEVSPGNLRYHLKNNLGISYKKNALRPAEVFTQKTIENRFRAAKAIISSLESGEILISIDESGFTRNLFSEFSWFEIGKRPYRSGVRTSKTYNLIMAIMNNKILAYSFRLGSHNSLSIVQFLTAVSKHILKQSLELSSKVSYILDNASFHHSHLTESLLEILPFKVIFIPAHFCELNPIEQIFGVLKNKLKRLDNSTE